jgi:hypothetical protein
MNTETGSSSRREVAIPPRTAELLFKWMNSAVLQEPEAYVFAGERGKPIWRDTLLYDHIRPKLKPLGLEWVNFQVMRATHASIGHRLKLDPKDHKNKQLMCLSRPSRPHLAHRVSTISEKQPLKVVMVVNLGSCV